jgi:hypothetical protein
MKRHALYCAIAVALYGGQVCAAGIGGTIFLNHFDTPNADPNFAGNAADADYAAGNAAIFTQPPPFSNAPGGVIASSPAKFAKSMFRSGVYDTGSGTANVGGLVLYEMADNFNLQRGTIDMWIDSGTLSTDSQFRGLFGTYVGSTAPGDIRMYMYNAGGVRTLGAYMIDNNGAAQHWETEGAIPVGSLSDNTWHHVAWEWDLSLHQSAIYWDGSKLAGGATNGKTIQYAGTPSASYFHVGAGQAGSGLFPGYMDEFRISDVMRYNGASFTPPTGPYVLAAPGSIWMTNGDGLWTDPSNWSATVPQTAGSSAVFSSSITAPHTITLDAPITIGHLQFDNANRYTIAGTATNNLTFQVASGTADITLTSGSHSITAPISLTSSTNIVGPGNLTTGSITNLANLDVQTNVTAGNIDGAGGNVTVESGSTLSANRVRQNGLTVNGTLAISVGRSNSKTSVVSSLTIGGGATLDLADNDLIIDYTGESPLTGVRAALASGYAGGAWNGAGIASSVAAANLSSHRTALGYGEASALGIGSFSGQSVDLTAIVVRYTLAGDANLDGAVNSQDFTALAAHFNSGSGGWIAGDFNYDEKVNALDFNAVASNFGSNLPSVALGSLIPEPMMLAPAIVALGAQGRRRRI